MKVSNNINNDQNQSVAFNAILTVPDSDSSSLSEFLTYIENNQFTPVARMSGFPVYRLNDIQSNAQCYMSNERYANEYLPKDVRCQSMTDREGRFVRVIDYGPTCAI